MKKPSKSISNRPEVGNQIPPPPFQGSGALGKTAQAPGASVAGVSLIVSTVRIFC